MLMLEAEVRNALWRRLIEAVERYTTEVASAPVAPPLDVEAVRGLLAGLDFARPAEPLAALDVAVEGLWKHQVHAAHPRYFGLFNPAPTTMGIAADTLVAAFNPQLAAWSHSPLAVEIEQHLVRAFGERFGYDPARVEGTFTTGGAEANHTALLTAMMRAFPEIGRRGLLALRSQPVLYVSAEGHHSFAKAARLCGLGSEAVREVRVDARLRMRPEDLLARIREDREAGLSPFFVVATAGSTGAGVVDPLEEIAQIADEERLWLHVDAGLGRCRGAGAGAQAGVAGHRARRLDHLRRPQVAVGADGRRPLPDAACRHPGAHVPRRDRLHAARRGGAAGGGSVYALHAVVAALHRPQGLPLSDGGGMGRV